MSLKKGYTYTNINEFCEKYKCKLLSSENEINNNDSKELKIQSRCGHETIISFNKLFKYKIGIFCGNCFKNYEIDGIECITCNNKFMPTNDKVIFCSIACSRTRIVTDEQKQKTRTTFCKKLNYYDDTGNLMDSTKALKQLKLNRIKIKMRKNGVNERYILTYDIINTEYDKKDCVLLTTKEEFDKLKSRQELDHIKFTIKSSCGHIGGV